MSNWQARFVSKVSVRGAIAMLVAAANMASCCACPGRKAGQRRQMTIVNGSDIKSWDPAITSGTFPGGPMDVLGRRLRLPRLRRCRR